MKYNVEFLAHLSQTVDLYVIIEKGKKPQTLMQTTAHVALIDSRYTILRIIKTFLHLTNARIYGYKKVYVHYSFIAAFLATLIPGSVVYYWNCGMPWEYKRPVFQEMYERLVYKRIDHLVTGAHVLINQYAEYYKFNASKVVIVPNWIDVPLFAKKYHEADRNSVRAQLNILPESKVLFFVQRLSERKGAHYLPQIMEAMLEDVVLIVTGDGPYEATLIKEIQERRLENKFRMLGRVVNERMPDLFKASDIFILPSEEEGMAHALLESMSAGIATVAFDVGGTIDMFPAPFSRYVAPAKNIAVFINHILFLLSNENERNILGRALFEGVSAYDLPRVLQAFKERIID
ncbi:MAG: glycosyl transferase group 1 [Candidatus Kaiserbacteria bacterium]|nr:glycosyl transferase group 1 [Candidatus Kaiserbacteria bacterium]